MQKNLPVALELAPGCPSFPPQWSSPRSDTRSSSRIRFANYQELRAIVGMAWNNYWTGTTLPMFQ